MIALAAILSATDPWSRGDQIAAWALAISIVAIILGLLTLHRGNKNSSVASMIPLNAEIRNLWDQYVASFGSGEIENPLQLATLEIEIASKLEELMNVLEIAAAIEVEGTLSGVSRVLMRDYLRRMLGTIISDSYTNAKVSELLQDENTYIFIRRFLKQRENMSVVLPPHWYAYPEVSWMQRARSFFRY